MFGRLQRNEKALVIVHFVVELPGALMLGLFVILGGFTFLLIDRAHRSTNDRIEEDISSRSKFWPTRCRHGGGINPPLGST